MIDIPCHLISKYYALILSMSILLVYIYKKLLFLYCIMFKGVMISHIVALFLFGFNVNKKERCSPIVASPD